MPTYDYRCNACGHAFEHFQSMSDARLKKCPSCGKAKLERLIGAGAGLIFKGSGFYITDYRTEGYHEAAKKDAAASGGGDAKAATATDRSAAPAAKGDPKPSAANPATPPAASANVAPTAPAPTAKPSGASSSSSVGKGKKRG